MEDYYVIDNAFPLDLFRMAFDEFHPMHNFRYEEKLEASSIPLELHLFYPTWSGLEKPSMSEGLGDSLPLIKAAVHAKFLTKKTLRCDVELVRVNTNIQRFGQEATFHCDGDPGEWTFLVYVMPTWDLEWGGDFIIHLGERDYRGIACLPNRAILFKAPLQHRGSAPNRLCNSIRYSVAFTFREVQ